MPDNQTPHGDEWEEVDAIIQEEIDSDIDRLGPTCEECGHELNWFEREVYSSNEDRYYNAFIARCQYCGTRYVEEKNND